MKGFSLDFNKALDGVLDGIERNVVDRVREAAADALDEYPEQSPAQAAIPPADWESGPTAVSFWRLFNLEAKKMELHAHLDSLSRDSLTRQAGTAEQALQEICELLLRAPDPLPYLNEGLSLQASVKELQLENKRLQKDTIAAEREATEAVSVVNQVQKSEAARAELISQLEEQRQQITELQEDLVSSRELQLWHARLQDEQRRTQEVLASLQAEHQRVENELFELRAAREEEASAKADDADLAAQEAEQAAKRIRQLEWEVKQLQEKLSHEAVKRNEPAHNASNQEQSRTREIQRLQIELNRAKQEQSDVSNMELAEAHDRLQFALQEVEQLKAELRGRASAEEVRELKERLQTAEALLDAQMAAEEPDEESATPENGTTNHATSLVMLLQARNRRLVAENSGLRRKCEEAEISAVALRKEVQAAQEMAATQTRLLSQVENDLLLSSQGGSSRPGSTDDSNASGSLLQIVAGQRDRFRARVEQLEEEASQSRGELDSANSKAEALQADNVALYERIRYLQRYSAQQGRGVPAGASTIVRVDGAGIPQPQVGDLGHRLSCGPLQLNLGNGQARALRNRGSQRQLACLGGDDDPDEETGLIGPLDQRYSKAYASKINPFAEFQAEEREGRLPAHERALLSGSKMLLTNRAGRVFAISYLVLLHAFLFCLVYYILVTSATVQAVSSAGMLEETAIS